MNSKKIIGIAIGVFVIAAAAAIVISSRGRAKGKFVDGEWPGMGEGRNGPIELTLSVKGGKITGAKVTKESETGFAQPAEQFVIDQVVAKQSVEGLDIMSGATITSNATMAALQAAVKASKGETAAAEKATDTSCDIVIIGAGGAGLTAATEAAHRGAKVIVLEKMGIVGGNTNSATGGLNAAYTKEQEKLGIKDSKEQFFEDTMKGGKNLNDPALVHTLVDNSAAIVEWLQSDIVGADLSDVGLFGGATNKRIHRPQGGAAIGSHLVPLLY
ncbi:MAG: FAD-dependent oxidoreductase, partial [Treponema socranskii subsp. buccale]